MMQIPEVGKVFELTSNGTTFSPMGLVSSSGVVDTTGWTHSGPRERELKTRKFKLVNIDEQANIKGVRLALNHTMVPEGQWIDAFRAVYQAAPDTRVSIGVADPAWKDPRGSRCFPSLESVYIGDSLKYEWRLEFNLENGAGVPFEDTWRWLVFAD